MKSDIVALLIQTCTGLSKGCRWLKFWEIIGVGLGGIAGSLLRYSIGVWSLQHFGNHFPYGTIFANLVGSFLLGWFTSKVIEQKRLNPVISTSISTGVIGSFTTFSTFSVETVTLWSSGQHVSALIYIFISTVGGLLLAFMGYQSGIRKRNQVKATGGTQR